MEIRRGQKLLALHNGRAVEVKVVRYLTPTCFLVETTNGLVEQWTATIEARFVLLDRYKSQELQPELKGTEIDTIA